MKERDGEEQPMAEKQTCEAMKIKMKKNIFLAPSVNTIAVSKVLERD